jgi:hypothetical protein
MNFYKISYKRSTSWFFLRTLESDLRIDEVTNIDEFALPAMKCTVSMQRAIWIFGEAQILEYLYEHMMIGVVSHKTSSAWEAQGIQWAKSEIEPHLSL